MNSETSNERMALKGIRVVDFGQGAIAPMTTTFLASFGAEVIKVESYHHLDFGRRGEFFLGNERDPNKNYHFSRYNQNKFGVLINLTFPKGVELAKKLVSVSDVVIENFSANVIHRLGLGYEELRKVKPDIVMLSASFGGQRGPYRDFRGQGNVIHALQGLNDLTGWPDRPPSAPAAAFGDHYLPCMWAIVILSALQYRRRTGRGQFIDGSSFEGCLDVLDTAIADYDVNGRILRRRGNRHPAAAPHGVFRCKGDERWCAISVFSDDEWKSLCGVLGNPAWTEEMKFSTTLGRLENVEELEKLLEEWTKEQTAEEVMSKLQAVGVPAGVAQNIGDLHRDPQLAYRGHFWAVDEPALQQCTFEAPSARLSKTPPRFQRPGPILGEHNDYVFLDLLGLDSDEYGHLVVEGVIG